LAEIDGPVTARKFVDLDKNRRAKPHYLFAISPREGCCTSIGVYGPRSLESQNDQKIGDFQLHLGTESAQTY
jgi:hypothetical protein